MTSPASIAALRERVEKAEGPDRKLGRQIAEALGSATDHFSGEFDGCTESLDAALALVERVLPDHSPGVGQNVHHKYWHAYVQRISERDAAPYFSGEADAPTPALALLAAMLKAMEEKQ